MLSIKKSSPRYAVLVNSDLNQLIGQVNKYIDNGWEPQGGLVVIRGRDCDHHAQAVFLRHIPPQPYAASKNDFETKTSSVS